MKFRNLLSFFRSSKAEALSFRTVEITRNGTTTLYKGNGGQLTKNAVFIDGIKVTDNDPRIISVKPAENDTISIVSKRH